MKKYRLDEQNRRKRRKKVRRMKMYLIGMAIAVFVLVIYIVILLVSLIVKTTEYREEDMENQVVQEAPVNSNDIIQQENDTDSVRDKTMEKLEAFAEQNNFTVEEYPIELIELLEKNPEAEELVLRHLQQDRPIICAMGPGAFTESGHFIVFVGTKDGKIMVNDPNSKIRSEQLWSFEDIKYQIKNMWVYS